jgi:hypothetical protein
MPITPKWHMDLMLLDLAITDSQRWAFELLTARGFRFLVHFGVENCEQMADEIWKREPVC